MDLISFGDRIEPGNYSVFSRFRNILNFVWDGNIISLGNQNIQKGPTNIIVNNFDFREVNSLIIDNNFIIIDNKKLKIEKHIRYDSGIKFSENNFHNLQENLGMIEDFLIKNAHPKSLVFLLDERREDNFQSGFEKIFVESLKAGFNDIISGNILEGVGQIKGKGFGLTPSGDDFICGMLYGIYLIQEGKGKDLSELRNEIFQKAKSNNLISNNFLWMAKEGRFFEFFRDFINSRTHPRPLSLGKRGEKKDSKSLESSKIPLFFKEGLGELKKIISTGETSGADMLTGFLITMKRII